MLLRVEEEWYDLSRNVINCQIMLARMKADKTIRDIAIIKNHALIIENIRDKKMLKHSVFRTASEVELNLTQFINLDKLYCETMNEETGCYIRFSLLDYILSGKYVRYSLVLLGPPGRGKTRLMEAMLAQIAMGEQADPAEAYFLVVSSPDALRKAQSLFQPGVPLGLDEFMASEARGNRPPPTLAMMKNVLEVHSASTMDARSNDLAFASRQARIVTSNARTHNQWHGSLPETPLANLTDSQRRALDGNSAKALYKRAAFCTLTCPVLEEEKRKAFWAAEEEAAAKRQRTLFASMSSSSSSSAAPVVAAAAPPVAPPVVESQQEHLL